MRPAMGAVILVYPRLMRAVFTAASARWMLASATATASRLILTWALAASRADSASLEEVTAWSRWLAEQAFWANRAS